ncbi:MurR/RpiR family transcriptional regulator [Pseudonocardia cypriaca]|uniref:DNA-binding MurR/RpiR family transcriptional regulator n=1 Tax=Pseudonocardia cypriaca TaxID=882449 RepID=A0A543GBH8_9PSEU|nr:SIS domain-containing protein [Pseudonocardia cypriaca]TQM43440.1 DNA-binding MurR/RpiR family transcriptional regulator [Pseudonocardia cypriaca]
MTAENRQPENRQLSTPDERYGARLQRRSTATALLQQVVAQETANLSATLERLQADGSLEQAARRIVAAKRRFVTGGSKSWSYASLLATDLSASMANVVLIDGTVVRAVDVLSDVRPGDVLVAFSLRRYARSTIAIAEEFAAAGGAVVGVTDDADSAVARVAGAAVVVSTDSASYADSPTAVAAVVHILATLAAASAKGARRRLARRDALTARLGVYAEGD